MLSEFRKRWFSVDNAQPGAPRVRPTLILEDHFPQPVEDRKIAEEVKLLKDFVGDHVDTFYRSLESTDHSRSGGHSYERDSDDDFSDEEPTILPTPSAPVLTRRTEYIRTGSSNECTEHSNPDRAQQRSPTRGESSPRSWRGAIHRTIARVIIDSIDPYGNERDSFLPREIAQFLRAIPQNDNSELFNLAVSEWRIHSSYLLNLHRSEKHQNRRYLEERNQNIRRAAETLDRHLANYIDPANTKERVEHLESLMQHAADLGVCLLRQPARYEFSWTQPEEPRESRHPTSQSAIDRSRKSRNSIRQARFPALLKVTDNYGRRFSRPQRISSAEWDKQRTSRRTTGEPLSALDAQSHRRLIPAVPAPRPQVRHYVEGQENVPS